jgi:hypothetical protein
MVQERILGMKDRISEEADEGAEALYSISEVYIGILGKMLAFDYYSNRNCYHTD